MATTEGENFQILLTKLNELESKVRVVEYELQGEMSAKKEYEEKANVLKREIASMELEVAEATSEENRLVENLEKNRQIKQFLETSYQAAQFEIKTLSAELEETKRQKHDELGGGAENIQSWIGALQRPLQRLDGQKCCSDFRNSRAEDRDLFCKRLTKSCEALNFLFQGCSPSQLVCLQKLRRFKKDKSWVKVTKVSIQRIAEGLPRIKQAVLSRILEPAIICQVVKAYCKICEKMQEAVPKLIEELFCSFIGERVNTDERSEFGSLVFNVVTSEANIRREPLSA